MTEPTKDEICKVLAESDGWTEIDLCYAGTGRGKYMGWNPHKLFLRLPNYFEDLTACNRVENKILDDEQHQKFVRLLWDSSKNANPEVADLSAKVMRGIVSAPAGVRARCLWQVLSKNKEGVSNGIDE